MTRISRSLAYSLIIHVFVLGVLVFNLFPDSKKESRTPIKLQMICSCSTPATLSEPTNPQPITKTNPPPVQKTIPLTSTIVPTPQIKPSLPAPTSMTTTPIQVPITKTTPPQETPKIVQAQAPQVVQSINVEKEFLDAHLGEIRALLIQNLKYPRNAQRLKMQGEVRVGFRLKSDGSVDNIEVIKSSGFEILDEDAKALIKNTAPQFPKPSKSISLSIPLNYLLR